MKKWFTEMQVPFAMQAETGTSVSSICPKIGELEATFINERDLCHDGDRGNPPSQAT